MSLVSRIVNGIQIETGVAVPPRTTGLRVRTKSPESTAIEQLAPGESFVVMPREGKKLEREIIRFRQLTATKRKLPGFENNSYAVAANPVGVGIRIWRTK